MPAKKKPRKRAPPKKQTKVQSHCNDKEIAFINELMKKPGNGSAAIIAAAITDKPDVAKVYASQYLDRPHVLAELQRRRDRLMDRTEISLDRVLEELRRIGFATPGQFGDKMSVRMHDKLGALRELRSHLAPSPAEVRAAAKDGSGATIIIEGGPTGLEITVKEKAAA